MIESISETAGAGADLKKAKKQSSAREYARPTNVDRLPPHAPEMEQGALACQLLAPNENIAEVIRRSHGNPTVHYDLRHQEIQRALFAMYEARTPIEVITLQQWLKDQKLLDQIGGIAYLAQIQDAAPSAANLSYYLDIVWEKFLLRQMISTCVDVVSRIYDHEGDVEALLDQVEADVLRVNDLRTAARDTRPWPELVYEDLERIENMKRGVGTVDGLRTHLGHLDKWTCGLHNGELIVIAARPSVGKTSLGLTIAANVAYREKAPVGVFSLEMNDASLVRRALCAESHVDSHKLRTGFASAEDLIAIRDVGPRVSSFKLHVDDTPSLGILELKARARRMHSRHGIRLLLVDYLQLLRGHSNKDYRGNREREIADISAGLKALARELNVPVLVLSQLNREMEKNKSRKPQLADLRDSGAIEQDADQVWMLYRPKKRKDPVTGQIVDVSDDPADTEEEQPVNLLIAKQRNGPSDWDVELLFLKPYTHFVDAYGNRGKVHSPGIPEAAASADP